MNYKTNEEEKGKLVEEKIEEVTQRQKDKAAMDTLFTEFATTTNIEGRRKLIAESDPRVITNVLLKTMDIAENIHSMCTKVDTVLKEGLSLELKGIVDPKDEDRLGVEVTAIIPQNSERPSIRSCCLIHVLEELAETCVIVGPEDAANVLANISSGGETIH